MIPRRRHTPIALRSGVQPADLAAGEAFRPSMTGAFPRRRAMPSGAMPIGSLPDPLSFVHDEDTEAPKVALL